MVDNCFFDGFGMGNILEGNVDWDVYGLVLVGLDIDVEIYVFIFDCMIFGILIWINLMGMVYDMLWCRYRMFEVVCVCVCYMVCFNNGSSVLSECVLSMFVCFSYVWWVCVIFRGRFVRLVGLCVLDVMFMSMFFVFVR